MILNKELLKDIWMEKPTSKMLVGEIWRSQGWNNFLEKQSINKVFCFIFLRSNKITFLLHLSSGMYVKVV